MKKKFCKTCGRQRNIIYSGTYNESTGKEILTHEDCPVKDCKHDHHIFKKNIFGSYKNCSICGELHWEHMW